MVDFLDPRYLFSASMVVLAMAGLSLIFINTLTKASGAHRNLALTKALWKFELDNAPTVIRTEQTRAWYKLVCSGVMICALATSVLVRFIQPLWALVFSVLGFFVWIIYLFVHWHNVVKTPPLAELEGEESQSKTQPKSGWLSKARESAEDRRLPVTVVTGFLGSGKTTLLRHLLNNTVGMKILVIENELGEESIDHELLMQHTKQEDIIMMKNGCICCTVRNDLLTTFRRMFSNDAFAQLDWVVIETTGLADPAPLIQSFYMDSECQKRMRVDGVLTMVDAKHLPLHLSRRSQSEKTQGAHGGISEALLQISFADRILLNKTDLIGKSELLSLRASLTELNPSAQILECKFGQVEIEKLLDIRAFDPNKCTLCLETSKSILVKRSDSSSAVKTKVALRMRNKVTKNTRNLVTTFSFVSRQPLDLHKFNDWISRLLQMRGPRIFRLKGILHMSGFPEKFVCHGVHMLFDGEKSKMKWENECGESRLVFIGMDLDKEELQTGFESTIHL